MLRSSLIVGLSVSLAIAAAGCGGGGRRANVSPGPMPEGGTFTGIWHSPQYGEMHFSQTGTQVVGCYTKDERRGRVQGTVQGNLMRFEWSERRELVSGRPVTTRGHGYFQYRVGDDGDSYATGEWGHDADETGGGEWNAVRDRRRTRRPDPDTCGAATTGDEQPQGDSFESSGGGDSFDSSSSDSGGGDDLGGL
ncbi:hypothetical protein [Sandaracinus amylolyticus]|uniref:Lipoprotein n=1 Tax=Sandaracinus amylolyticus TaxID=927083 RepID=A0A0F6W596_9BACT|nr:hypothetical protein [Sandaracinus amylolyticus]AKF07767.1 hypothetical protein DB32_004916 [Sandaracinus amylolyticus]